MASEQFSLCWDNFHSNMSTGLSSLLKSEDLVDVTLAAEGRYLKAHKMVLSVCSPYFRELFQTNPCQHPIVFLKDVSFCALSNLLEFMYQGEVKVSQDDLGTFIKTAEALKIKGLTGDGPTQSDAEADSTPAPESTAVPTDHPPPAMSTRKASREKSPPPVRKKMLGPASKRFKNDTDQQHQQQTDQTPTEAPAQKPPQPSVDQIMTFKMEPEDSTVSLTNDEEGNYDEATMDEMGLDNSADYMLDTTMKTTDLKGESSSMAETSDAVGENQGLYKFVVTQMGTLNLAMHQHLYRPRNMITGTAQRLWVCAWRDSHCPARCISHAGKLVSKKGMHNHPPQRDAIALKEATGQVCFRKLF